MRVKGQSILVTGAGNGIGEGIAKRMAEQGAVVTVNDIDAQRAQRVCQDIKASGGQAWACAGDVTLSADWARMVDFAKSHGQGLNGVVNNAGWTHRNRPALEVSEAEFDQVYAINVKSIYLSTIHAVPFFRQQGGGWFINIASTAGVRPRPWPHAGRGDEALWRQGSGAADV